MKHFLPQPIRTGALCLTLATATSTQVMAAPPPMVENTYAHATIGDLPGAIDEITGLIKKVSPDVDQQAVRSNLGRMLGDNNLESFPSGSGLMLVVPTSGMPYFLLETAEGQAQSLVDRFSQRVPFHIRAAANNLVIGSRDEAALNQLADGQTSAAAEFLASNNEKFLNILIDADRLTADKGQAFKDHVNRSIERMQQRDDRKTTAAATFMRAASNFALAVGKRLDVFTLKVDINDKGILIDRAGYAKNGIQLEQPEGPAPAELRSRLNQPQRPFVVYDHHLDTQSSLRALAPIFQETLEGIGLTPQEMAELREIYNQATQGYGDAFAGWFGAAPKKVTGETVAALNDPAAAQREIQMEAESANSGALKKLYSLMGKETSATLRENVRQVDGIQVSEFSFTAETTEDDDPYGHSGSYAIQDNILLLALGDVPIDPLLTTGTQASSAAPAVASRQHLEDGGFMYLDVYPGALGNAFDHPRAKAIAQRLGNSAIYTSAYVDQEKMRGLVLIPTDLLQNIALAVRENQSRRGQQGASNDTRTTGTDNP